MRMSCSDVMCSLFPFFLIVTTLYFSCSPSRLSLLPSFSSFIVSGEDERKSWKELWEKQKISILIFLFSSNLVPSPPLFSTDGGMDGLKVVWWVKREEVTPGWDTIFFTHTLFASFYPSLLCLISYPPPHHASSRSSFIRADRHHVTLSILSVVIIGLPKLFPQPNICSLYALSFSHFVYIWDKNISSSSLKCNSDLCNGWLVKATWEGNLQ